MVDNDGQTAVWSAHLAHTANLADRIRGDMEERSNPSTSLPPAQQPQQQQPQQVQVDALPRDERHSRMPQLQPRYGAGGGHVAPLRPPPSERETDGGGAAPSPLPPPPPPPSPPTDTTVASGRSGGAGVLLLAAVAALASVALLAGAFRGRGADGESPYPRPRAAGDEEDAAAMGSYISRLSTELSGAAGTDAARST